MRLEDVSGEACCWWSYFEELVPQSLPTAFVLPLAAAATMMTILAAVLRPRALARSAVDHGSRCGQLAVGMRQPKAENKAADVPSVYHWIANLEGVAGVGHPRKKAEMAPLALLAEMALVPEQQENLLDEFVLIATIKQGREHLSLHLLYS